jgi:hypothetical protein
MCADILAMIKFVIQSCSHFRRDILHGNRTVLHFARSYIFDTHFMHFSFFYEINLMQSVSYFD